MGIVEVQGRDKAREVPRGLRIQKYGGGSALRVGLQVSHGPNVIGCGADGGRCEIR